MLIYIGIFVLTVLGASLAQNSKSVFIKRFLYAVIFISLVLIAGLRDRTIGTDTGSYVGFFNDIRVFADVIDIGSKMNEYGFWLMIWLSHFISDQYVIYLLVLAVIVVGCYQWTILNYSTNITISFFLFLAMGFYTFSFNGARQSIAIAIYLLAIMQIIKGNFIRYLGFVLLAFFFHKTAITLLPLYFLFNRPNSYRNNLLLFFMGCIAVFFLDVFIELAASFEPRWSTLGARGEGGGYFMVAFSFLNALVFEFFKNSIRINRFEYDRFLNIFYLGTMIGITASILGTNPSGFLRIRFYFTPAILFLWPIIFKNLPSRLSKFTVANIFFFVFFVYYILTTEKFSDLAPYKFNSTFVLFK